MLLQQMPHLWYSILLRRQIWYALRPASFSMEVMVHGEPVKLLLVQQNILAEDFRVTTSSHPEGENYSPGVYYRGIIQGDETSLAAISVFEDGLMGLFSGDLWEM